jgi:acetylornithine deacetylase
MALSELERSVTDVIAQRGDELVALASSLVALDTTARNVGDPARDEAELQRLLADRQADAGAEIDLFEPTEGETTGRPLVPDGLDFAGRPQLIAIHRGAGGGRSLAFNGHIDVVSAEPLADWTSPPFEPEIRDGRLYGRGSCDMKGGVAAMAFAAEVLAQLGVRLAGDLIVATNTDEESSGAGGSALVARGLRADAGIVTEPTNFRVWIACRGSEYGVITVPGRAGHAEVRHPDWRDGGAVNAIDKSAVVIEAMAALRERWGATPDLQHPVLSPPSIVATLAAAGDWPVTIPASCELTIAVMYLAAQADERGWGSQVRTEVERSIIDYVARDDWLAANPPQIRWWSNGVMPMELSQSEPIVETMLDVADDTGHGRRLGGLDSWYDGATLTTLAGIPSIGYGPPGFDPDGATIAHTVDEFVPVDGLIGCAQGLAVAAMRYCGLA